jgi:succinyl-CoA synthetase alpha subunit
MLLSAGTRVLVQGITGKKGQKAARAMRDYGTEVFGGVTPGKGGQTVDGLPVWNTAKEAIATVPADLHAHLISAVYVPPFAAKTAILEAIDANVPLLNVMTERIPIHDTAYCLAAAKEKNIRIIGPSSLGFIRPGVARIGVVGGPLTLVNEIFMPGSIGYISRSGGMTNEISWQIRKAGMGQSMVVHIGGDLLVGTTYADLLEMFEQDSETKAVVILGEHGGSYEFEIASAIEQKKYSKPLAVYIGGKFASQLPEGVNIGHAGAIVERGKGAAEKEEALRVVGVMIADRPEDLVTLIKPFA